MSVDYIYVNINIYCTLVNIATLLYRLIHSYNFIYKVYHYFTYDGDNARSLRTGRKPLFPADGHHPNTLHIGFIIFNMPQTKMKEDFITNSVSFYIIRIDMATTFYQILQPAGSGGSNNNYFAVLPLHDENIKL